jgi:dihydroorotate dehydrogenase electron transfer subunit
VSLNQARLLSNTTAMPGVHLLWLEAPGVAEAAEPGQFVMVACGPGLTLRRPLAVHRVQHDRVALLVRESGRGTRYLCSRRPGDTVDLLGPRGRGFWVEKASRRLLLVAGGMGIAPITFLAEWARAQGKEVTLLHGAHTADALQAAEHFSPAPWLLQATEDGTAGHRGTATGLLTDLSGGFDQAFAAGPLDMYRALQEGDFPVLNGKPVQVTLEARLGCGFGACFGCGIPTTEGVKMVCQDGPVFELSRVLLEGLRL